MIRYIKLNYSSMLLDFKIWVNSYRNLYVLVIVVMVVDFYIVFILFFYGKLLLNILFDII